VTVAKLAAGQNIESITIETANNLGATVFLSQMISKAVQTGAHLWGNAA
jgi:hypothetical protein